MENSEIRFDKLLCKKFDISFSLAQKLIREKKVKINGKKAEPSYRVVETDEIQVFVDLANRLEKTRKKPKISPQKIEKFLQNIIFEDENMIAINKISGIAVQGGSGITLSIDDILSEINKNSENKLQLVHRLDKDTSGILLIAKGKKSADFLVHCFKNKKIEKTYLALVYNPLKKKNGVINIPLRKKFVEKNEKVHPDFQDGKEAITHYKLLKNFRDFALVEFKPITGRTHQIRVHAKEIGHAIINDVKYGGKKTIMRDLSNRLCLHAKEIKIVDYFGEELSISAPFPEFLDGI